MKNFFGYIMAGLIGGFVVLGGLQLSDRDTISSVETVPLQTPMINKVALTNNAPSISVPESFSNAAAKATPAVVKIQVRQTAVVSDKSSQESPHMDLFKYFFGEEFDGGSRDFFNFGPDNSPRNGAGSGVIISSDGFIVTNNHVVENAGEIEVTLYDKRSFKATIIGTDKRTDLAVIKIESDNLPTLEYSNSENAKVGDWVLAIGNPFEYLTSTVTAGIISAKGRDINILQGNEKIESFIQTDAVVNPGNSGGALVDLDGNLIGINTAIATPTGIYAGYSFAIPVNLMKRIVEDIIEFGEYRRAVLGITIGDINSDLVKEYNLNTSEGVFVDNVRPGGAAELAGLLPKDVITGIDDTRIKSVPQLQALIGSKKAGEVVTLKVLRRNKEKSISVRLKEG
jgi:Do/DeqQ family serine protease